MNKSEEAEKKMRERFLVFLALEAALFELAWQVTQTVGASAASAVLAAKLSISSPRKKINGLIRDVKNYSNSSFSEVSDSIEKRIDMFLRSENDYMVRLLNTLFGSYVAISVYNEIIRRRVLKLNRVQWMSVSDEFVRRFTDNLSIGLYRRESGPLLIERITGSFNQKDRKSGAVLPMRNSIDIVTKLQVYSAISELHREFYKGNPDIVSGIKQISVIDERTSDICMEYDGATWDIEFNPILGNRLPYNGGVPRHVRCRSIEVPILVEPQ